VSEHEREKNGKKNVEGKICFYFGFTVNLPKLSNETNVCAPFAVSEKSRASAVVVSNLKYSHDFFRRETINRKEFIDLPLSLSRERLAKVNFT
jgi:hypothetical protein